MPVYNACFYFRVGYDDGFMHVIQESSHTKLVSVSKSFDTSRRDRSSVDWHLQRTLLNAFGRLPSPSLIHGHPSSLIQGALALPQATILIVNPRSIAGNGCTYHRCRTIRSSLHRFPHGTYLRVRVRECIHAYACTWVCGQALLRGARLCMCARVRAHMRRKLKLRACMGVGTTTRGIFTQRRQR